MSGREEIKLVIMNPQYVSYNENGYVATDDAPQKIKDAVALVNANEKKDPNFYD